jgi:hypothetical protein
MRMQTLTTALRHLLALFADDASLAVPALLWLALTWWAVTRWALPGRWSAPLLFAGLALILAFSALRRARAG